MSNKNCVAKSVVDGNEACDTHINGNRVVGSAPMNRQLASSTTFDPSALPLCHRFAYESPSSPIANNNNKNRSFINGDLIDLDEQINDRKHLSGDLVEAINSQLLADINGKSLSSSPRDCHILYPTKVSFDNKLSGTKRNHQTNHHQLNNSIDLTGPGARSSEAIGKCSHGESGAIANTTNEQHQTVIREFKRIGTYCTLRPEQRRKHLLKVLPTLRNSVLLQTLLGSTATPTHFNRTNSTTADELLLNTNNNDIDSLLIDLDDFIIDGNSTMQQRHTANNQQQFNSTDSFASTSTNCDRRSHSDTMTSSCIKMVDPDKVEDCLLELDAYLEEIDRDYVLACAAAAAAAAAATATTITTTTTAIPTATTTATQLPAISAVMPSSTANNAKSTKISANQTNDSSEKIAKNHIVRRFNMDNNYGDCEQRNGGPSMRNDHHHPAHHSMAMVGDCHSAITMTNAPNLRKQISNSDIQMNHCGKSIAANEINGSRSTEDNRRKSNGIANDNDNDNDSPLKRGHKLRNTVAGSGHINRTIALNDAPSQCVDNSPKEKSKAKNVAFSWRRLSMRKTCPIVLPEQPHSPKEHIQYPVVRSSHIARTTSSASAAVAAANRSNLSMANDFAMSNTNGNNDNHCLNETTMTSPSNASSSAYLLLHRGNNNNNNNNNEISSVLNGDNGQWDLGRTDDYDNRNQMPELSSLNNEFLNTILTTSNYQQSSAGITTSNSNLLQHETNFVLNNNDSDCATTTTATAAATTFEEPRPRQLGRRSEMRSRVVSITAERMAEGTQRIIVNCDTDNVQTGGSTSSPSSTIPSNQSIQLPPTSSSSSSQATMQRLSNQCQFTASEASCSSAASSRNPSPVSIASSTESSSGGSTSAGETNIRSTSHRTMNVSCENDASASNRANRTSNSHNSSSNSSSATQRNHMNSKAKVWPFGVSRIFAATCCTLGLFNMSRFSIFSIIFGANFIVQFLLLSFFLGIPMLWLQMCLGANIKGGPISMWRVSPICKGIGIALVLVQALMTIYSAVSIAWLLVYLRDSCVSSRYPWYRWQEIFEFFRGPTDNGIAIMSNTSEPSSTSSKLGETVADYFNGVILQRYQLGPGGRAASSGGIGAVRFQLAFNLSVVWLIVFIVLCKGLHFYGKAVIAMVSIPLIAFFVLTTKMLTLLNLAGFQNIFPATDWQEFFLNSQSWLSAAQEAFLTWSLLGASIISIFSKSSKNQQECDKALRRDALLVVAFTLIGLLLAAVFGNACVQILNDRGFYYFPGSFETTTSSVFLSPSSKPLPPQLATSLSKWLPRYSTLLGESYKRIDPNAFESGWQPIRIITEIFPATLAAATLDNVSSFWSLLGFSTFLCFGLAQLCAMWKPIATSMCSYSESISATSTTILLTCLAGLLLGIPLTTETGINIIYFLDSVIGGAWFVLLLWTGQIFAVFLVRGRPYSGDILVNRLHLGLTLSAFVALSWNLLLPIGLLTLCVLQYKISYSYDFYHWSGIISQSYWPIWTRKAAAFIQIGIFQIIPITAIIQTYRYLSKGPPDILDRFQLLYRPPISSTTRSHRYPLTRSDRSAHATSNGRQSDATTGSSSIPAIAVTLESNPSLMLDDAPPKYTPPPSYTTATGARIAKLLRNSIRRSVRRILGEPNCNNRRQRTALQTVESSFDQNPPDYSTIVATTSNHEHDNRTRSNSTSTVASDHAPPVLFNDETYRQQFTSTRRHTTTNFPSQKSLEKMDSFSLTMPRRQTATISSVSNDRCNFRNLTAHDVAQLLRSTQTTQITRDDNDYHHHHHHHNSDPHSIDTSTFPIDSDCIINAENAIIAPEQEDLSITRSVEELVLNEVPVGESNAAATFCDKNN